MNSIAWAAGLMDAEGSFVHKNPQNLSPHGGKQMKLALAMQDKDVVDRFSSLFEHRSCVRLGHKGMHSLDIAGKWSKEISAQLANYLCTNKRAKIERLNERHYFPVWSHLYDEDKVAWLAGFFEGDGCLTYDGKVYRLSVSGCDPEPIARFSHFFGVPSYVKKPHDSTYGTRTIYLARTGKRQTTLNILKSILPYLGKRRALKAKEVINAYT